MSLWRRILLQIWLEIGNHKYNNKNDLEDTFLR